ncbi:MAG: type III-B CRISPR module RAMP protein Cmr1 [bacterium]|nr:type III-B CRISPR module RAMP protein Cmr1 [bacterium]
MWKTLKCEVEVITPMFLGGADGRTAELRAPSIKGLLRFWWRAINNSDNLQQLKEKEDKIFGSSDAGKSSFSIKLLYDSINPSKNSLPSHLIDVKSGKKSFKINILEYLSYGCCEYNKNIRRNEVISEYFVPNTRFIILFLYNNIDKFKDVLKSLYYLNAFGGLGAKSRNGFGSFRVLNREIFKPIGEEYIKNVIPTKDILNKMINNRNTTDYLSFANGLRLFKAKNIFDSWDKSLAEIGKIYREARLNLEGSHIYMKRQYIGAPLNTPTRNNPNGGFKSFLERHAKPYFLKVIKEDDNKFSAYILFLPSNYCASMTEDRDGKKLSDWIQKNKEFEQICENFNNYLSKKMETLI